MGQPEFKPRLIHNRREAVIALCLTGYVAALSFRDVLSHSQHKSHWLVDLHFMLPTWAVAGVNLGFYAYLLWLGVVFYRIAQGKERVLVAGWFTGGFLGLIQNLVSASAAAAIDYVQAIGMVVAFLAAVDIFLRMPASGYPRLDNQTSRNT
jgi:hypothetical protein